MDSYVNLFRVPYMKCCQLPSVVFHFVFRTLMTRKIGRNDLCAYGRKFDLNLLIGLLDKLTLTSEGLAVTKGCYWAAYAGYLDQGHLVQQTRIWYAIVGQPFAQYIQTYAASYYGSQHKNNELELRMLCISDETRRFGWHTTSALCTRDQPLSHATSDTRLRFSVV